MPEAVLFRPFADVGLISALHNGIPLGRVGRHRDPAKSSTPVVVRGPGHDLAAVHEFTSVDVSCAENDATLEPMIVDRNAADVIMGRENDRGSGPSDENGM